VSTPVGVSLGDVFDSGSPLFVATPGTCVVEPPPAEYLAPMFLTPGVSKTFPAGVEVGKKTTTAPSPPAAIARLRGLKKPDILTESRAGGQFSESVHS